MSALYIIMNFNPRAPCGARPHWMTFVAAAALFQSTRPMRGATYCCLPSPQDRHVSIHAPHAGRDIQYDADKVSGNVSIHAPHAGRDRHALYMSRVFVRFNPRAPCGARRNKTLKRCRELGFQSTRPVWGATAAGHPQYPHQRVSIHAPRVGRDRKASLSQSLVDGFQSTRPVWGATKVGTVYKTTGKVSIHAPRVGRDLGGDKAASLALFQSTRPVWGATYDCPRPPLSQSVSIHAPRVGRDVSFFCVDALS